MNQNTMRLNINKIIDKSEIKAINLEGRRYLSILSEEKMMELYMKVYIFFAKRFDGSLLRKYLKFGESTSLKVNLVSIDLYFFNNLVYRIIPIDDKNVVYFMNLYENEEDVPDEEIICKSNSEILYKEDELIDEFYVIMGFLREAKVLEIKEDSFENKMYLKAMESYRRAILNIDKEEKEYKTVFVNNINASRMYINELINHNHNIEDKNFLADVYVLKSRIELLSKNIDSSYLLFKKATEISPTSQSTIVLALSYIIFELMIRKSVKEFNFVLDYILENIDNLNVEKGSIFDRYLMENIDEGILKYLKIKDIEDEYIDRLKNIYEIILEKMNASGNDRTESVNEVLKRLNKN